MMFPWSSIQQRSMAFWHLRGSDDGTCQANVENEKWVCIPKLTLIDGDLWVLGTTWHACANRRPSRGPDWWPAQGLANEMGYSNKHTFLFVRRIIASTQKEPRQWILVKGRNEVTFVCWRSSLPSNIGLCFPSLVSLASSRNVSGLLTKCQTSWLLLHCVAPVSVTSPSFHKPFISRLLLSCTLFKSVNR